MENTTRKTKQKKKERNTQTPTRNTDNITDRPMSTTRQTLTTTTKLQIYNSYLNTLISADDDDDADVGKKYTILFYLVVVMTQKIV